MGERRNAAVLATAAAAVALTINQPRRSDPAARLEREPALTNPCHGLTRSRDPSGVRLARWIGIGGAIGYLGVVAAFEVERSAGGGPRVRDLASSPSGLLSGEAWRLLSSGLIIAGEPVTQLAATIIAVIAVLVLFGPGLFWRAAFAGHVVATLIAYLGVAVLWLLARGDVDQVVDAPDYGISCVLAGTLGALTGAGVHWRNRWALPAAAIATALILAAVTPIGYELAGAEHGLAFALGCIIGLRTSASSPSASASAPSRA
jgi:hypothetical protein